MMGIVVVNYEPGRAKCLTGDFKASGLYFKIDTATSRVISPTHKRAEGRAPVWGSEFTSKDAALQGVSAKLLLG
jgi:hypothetical protein